MNKEIIKNGKFTTESYQNNMVLLSVPAKNMDWLLKQIKEGTAKTIYLDDASLVGLMASLDKQCKKWNKDNIKKKHLINILKYSYNLSDYFAIWTAYIMLQTFDVRFAVIQCCEWIEWAQKYKSIILDGATNIKAQIQLQQTIANAKKPLSVIEIMQEINKLDNTDKQIIKLYVSKF